MDLGHTSYSWVSNEAKFQRARKELKVNGIAETEEKLKELYALYGGLVLDKTVVEELEERKEVFIKRRKAKK